MPIGKVQFGSIYGIKQIQQQQASGCVFAANSNTNNNSGELRPVVKSDILANKLDILG